MTKKRSTDIRTCPVCGHQVQRSDMQFTRDCNGIPFRLECWRLMGYTDEEFEAAKAVHERKGRYYMTLYKQAGNSIAVPIFESIFRKIILREEKTKKDDSERQEGDAGR